MSNLQEFSSPPTIPAWYEAPNANDGVDEAPNGKDGIESKALDQPGGENSERERWDLIYMEVLL